MQLSFATNPKTLSWLQHDLRTDERVVRWLLTKQEALPPMPKTKEIKRLEAELCAPLHAARRRRRSAASPPGPIAGARSPSGSRH